MLSLAKLAPGQEGYHIREARRDYYLEGGEPEGRWLGRGAASLGLTDRVEESAFRYLFRGFSPDGSQPLGQHQHYRDGRKRQPGWDLCFSAPGSVSAYWSQLPADEREAIQRAHFQAVRATLAYTEATGAFGRRGKGGAEIERVGLVIAAFEHSTSRAQDPQLHTHALVLNLGARADGTFGTIRSRNLYQLKMTLGALYRAELARRLRALGLPLEPAEHGFRIRGVPRRLEEVFSTRRAQIVAAMEARGAEGAKAAEHIALTTRIAKGRVARSELFRQWRRVGEELGFSMEQVNRSAEQPLSTREHRESVRVSVEAAVDELKETRASFAEHDVLRESAMRLAADGASLAALAGVTKEVLVASDEVVTLAAQNGYEQFAAKANVAQQEGLSRAAEALHGRCGHTVRDKHVERALSQYKDLTEEQRSLVRDLAASSSDLTCLTGTAGTGKTTVLAASAAAWRRQGFHVLGVATTPSSVESLGTAAGIESLTVGSFLYRQSRPLLHAVDHHRRQIGRALSGKRTHRLPRVRLTEKTVLVVDDAELLGAGAMGRILGAAERRGAKVVLAGDLRPGASHDLRGPFEALWERVGGPTLTGPQRFRHRWMEAAVGQLAAGDGEAALTEFARRGYLHVADSRVEAMDALVSAWGKARGRDPSASLMIATRKDLRDELNRRAQALRRRRGELGIRSVRVGEVSLRAHDRVRFTHASPSLGIASGEFGTVERIEGRGLLRTPLVTVRLDREERRGLFHVPVRVTFLAEKHSALELAYAVEAHGLTVDRAFVLTERPVSQDRALTYHELSRAREETHVFAEQQVLREDLAELARRVADEQQAHARCRAVHQQI